MATAFAAVPLHTAESYTAALEALGPEPKYDEVRDGERAYSLWQGRKTALGEEPGEGLEVTKLTHGGGTAVVSTEDRYRIVEVPSGRILYELQDLCYASSTCDTIAMSRRADNEPYAIGVSYQLVAAMEKLQGALTWEDISLRPRVGYECKVCRIPFVPGEESPCGTTGCHNSSAMEQSAKCREIELTLIAEIAMKLRNEARLLQRDVTYETTSVVDCRYQLMFCPDMGAYDWMPADKVALRRRDHEEAAARLLASAG